MLFDQTAPLEMRAETAGDGPKPGPGPSIEAPTGVSSFAPDPSPGISPEALIAGRKAAVGVGARLGADVMLIDGGPN